MVKTQTIVINSQDYQNTGNKNSYVYRLPYDVHFKNHKIALQSITMFNSSYNISSEIGNNKIILTFLNNVHTLTIDDGFYEISSLNFWLQKQLILLGYYYSDTNYNFYNFEIVADSIRYGCQINYFYLKLESEALTNNFTKGGDWSWPTSTNTTSNNLSIEFNPVLATMLGFSQLKFPNTDTYEFNNSNDIQYTSDKTPQLNYINSYVIGCNLIQNQYSNKRSDILTSIPINVEYGLTIKYELPQIVFTSIIPSIFNSIIISFYDQNLQPLLYKDKNVNMILNILEED
jgi:hypothetical protein